MTGANGKNDFMARFSYDDLEEFGKAFNELKDSVEFLGELIAGCYPDTSRREARIDDTKAALTHVKADTFALRLTVERLIAFSE